MTSTLRRTSGLAIFSAAALAILITRAETSAAELCIVTPENWRTVAPAGKEVDCIYGDIVLRNVHLTAVVARPVEGRNANMTVRNTGGCLIDLTANDSQSDQLSAFYPGTTRMAWRSFEIEPDARRATDRTSTASAVIQAPSVSLACRQSASDGTPEALVRYTLGDGDPFLLVETTWTNTSQSALEITVADELRADVSFSKSPDGSHDLFWVHDRWFAQAYGIIPEGCKLTTTSNPRNSTLSYWPEGRSTQSLMPGESFSIVRRIMAGRDLATVRQTAADKAGISLDTYELLVVDESGQVVPQARIELFEVNVAYAEGASDASGYFRTRLPRGSWEALVSAPGGTIRRAIEPGRTLFAVPTAGHLAVHITDEEGGRIACKVQIVGREGTANPEFGHESGIRQIHNVVYSESGRFRQPLAPGRYECIVSHGPEHDAVFAPVTIEAGRDSPLAALLVRSVQTPGWISADLHRHSSPSGDNTSSTLGRVLNLLAEQVEFAPCTEHNRLAGYEAELVELAGTSRMATCVGIELTGSPGDVNHQNAFPLVRELHTQDGGAPLADVDPQVQIQRLAMWDDSSEKLVQQNHPDLGHVFFDKNADGQPDGGYAGSIAFMDVIEVHPPHWILSGPSIQSGTQSWNNTIFNWLQLLNQGHRVPGVVNTDAHYNLHGSGFLRVYVQSPTDDTARIRAADVVHSAEAGRMIMTSGPYLEVALLAEGSGSPGDTVPVPSGNAQLVVRVQCPNWFDIDRVQVFLNGKPDPKLNFTRESTPSYFTGGVVKFHQRIPVALAGDTHVIVAAASERSKLGPVMGPDHKDDMPIAVSNPIYVDVDGGGFTANGDSLGAPLPVAARRN